MYLPIIATSTAENLVTNYISIQQWKGLRQNNLLKLERAAALANQTNEIRALPHRVTLRD